MRIASMFGAQDIDPASIVTGEKRRRYEGGITSTLAQGDVASISEEALALAAKWRQERRKQALEAEAGGNPGVDALAGQTLAQRFASGELAPEEEAEGLEMSEREVPGEQAVGGASAQDSIESLEKKIEELRKKIIEVHSSDLPEDTKEAQINSLQAQISQLARELSAAKQLAAKKA